ncbi:MAG: exo-alpha-sialidase [Bacteroidota bacterium]|nr:exo-alpha-sialidase [Bacteroidota bacterium]
MPSKIFAVSIAFTLAASAQDTLYMSVLSSHAYRIGAQDNPIVGLFGSADGGNSWHHEGWINYIRVFYTEAASDGTLWSACGNGVLRSTDAGASWKITTGWQITEALKVRADNSDPSVVYAATAYGIFKTTDHGATWKKKSRGLPGRFTADVIIDEQNHAHLFAATEEGVYVSRDAGGHWMLCGLKGKGIRMLLQEQNNPQTLWAGTEDDGLLKSENDGATWKPMNNGLSAKTVYALASNPSDSRLLFAGTHGGGVFRSRDGGEHWTQQNNGLTNLVVHALLVLPSHPQSVFAGTLNGGLFRSDDEGNSWKFVCQPEAQVWGLSVR